MQRDELRELVKSHMLTPAVSGHEKLMAERMRSDLSKYCDSVEVDKIGNVIGTIKGTKSGAHAIMLYGHMDNIGFVIKKIDEQGFIYCDRVGGVPEKTLQVATVIVESENGQYVKGIFGCKSYHVASDAEKAKADTLSTLFIDIGAQNDQEVFALGIHVGCVAMYEPRFTPLLGERFAGTFIDDRMATATLVNVASMLSNDRPECTVYIVGTVWEEFNLRGAMIASRTHKVDIGICVDGFLASDTPDTRTIGNAYLGKGPGVQMFNFHGKGTLNGYIINRRLYDIAKKAAKDNGIEMQRFASRGVITDSAYLQLEEEGVACIEFGCPGRYGHSPVEHRDMRDVEGLGNLVYAFIKEIKADTDISRY